MRRSVLGILTAALCLGLTAALTPAAGAAGTGRAAPVAIASPIADYGKRAVVKPRVSTTGRVVVLGSTLTVKQKKKVLVRSQPSASLKPGRYRVTSAVRYRSWTPATRMVPRRSLVVEEYENVPATCRVTSFSLTWETFTATCSNPAVFDGTFVDKGSIIVNDDDTLWLYSGFIQTDWLPQDSAVGFTQTSTDYPSRALYKTTMVPQTYRAYGPVRTASKNQKLVVRERPKPRGCATRREFNTVRDGMTKAEVNLRLQSRGKRTFLSGSIESRDYKPCRKNQSMSVSFEDGRVYDKTFWSF